MYVPEDWFREDPQSFQMDPRREALAEVDFQPLHQRALETVCVCAHFVKIALTHT